MDKTEREFQRIRLKNKQRYLTKQFQIHGLTEDILKEQLEINKLRHELDIHDEEDTVHEEYVQ